MDMGEYICGMEPCNSFVDGRKVEKENGTLKFSTREKQLIIKLNLIL